MKHEKNSVSKSSLPYRVACAQSQGPLARAVADLCRDIGRVVGVPGELSAEADASVVVEVDASIPGPEGYRIEHSDGQTRIAGTDQLGTIFGVYAFTHEVLGIDPYWFWKELEPEPQDSIPFPSEPIVGEPPAFRYRGWFLNDEDLLVKWRLDGGKRNIDYPYYDYVTHPEVLDAVCETLLRTGGNMIIPASFLDVMNPDEARMVEVCVARGLYVTQHHIEPLGVSHFGYETYWQSKGVTTSLRYTSEPERVRQTWRDYAQRWYELAGNQVIWQLGLRGRGDIPIWMSDKTIRPEQAGQYITNAIADQWAIVQDIDVREVPPATATMWDEGSELLASGEIQLPKPVAVIFSDTGSHMRMQRDFYELPRETDRDYGAYTHVAFWSRGPHLVAGQPPERAASVIHEIASKGDSYYAIVNTSNVREHIFGIDATMQSMWRPEPFDAQVFWQRHLPQEMADLGPRYFDALVRTVEDAIVTDGDVRTILNAPQEERKKFIAASSDPTVKLANFQRQPKVASIEKLLASAQALEAVAAEASNHHWPKRLEKFGQFHFVIIPSVLACLYRMLAASGSDPDEVITQIERLLQIRKPAATGRFENWYRGEDKANWPKCLEYLKASGAPKCL